MKTYLYELYELSDTESCYALYEVENKPFNENVPSVYGDATIYKVIRTVCTSENFSYNKILRARYGLNWLPHFHSDVGGYIVATVLDTNNDEVRCYEDETEAILYFKLGFEGK